LLAKEERCQRCTRQEMWAAYDVFRSMDKRNLGRISRYDYLETKSHYPTLDKLRVLRRVDLESRFRENGKDVTLQEFLHLMWPHATEQDRKKMMHWAKLRDAQDLVRAGNYTGESGRLQEIFDLLDKDHNELLDDHELLGILEKCEVEQMMNETAAHRAKFIAETTDKKAEHRTEGDKALSKSTFKKLLFRGKTSSSRSVQDMIDKEKALKNKLTFDEFCHLVQPRQQP
jgi:Ca2+-binding EF-hand superfamily protein